MFARSLRTKWADFDRPHLELQTPALSREHEGVRVAQLSDLHVGPGTPDARIRAAVAYVNELRPDVVLLTGDFITRLVGRPRFLERLAGIEAPTFAVLGNHDHWVDAAGVTRELTRHGYVVLRNQHRTLHVHGAPLTVVGIDDGFTEHADVARAFAGVPETGSRLVMLHTPWTADGLPEGTGLLCFSGHTHGGQFVIPGLTEPIARRIHRPYMRGLHEVRGNLLYVNRGLGFGRGGPMVRVGAAPEVPVFMLRSGALGGSPTER